MDSQNQTPAMNQEIFNLDLSVETVSVYLICCSLSDNNTAISTKNLSRMWNGTEELLIEGLKDLEERNILRKIISDRDEKNIYQLTDLKDWKQS
jgi:DNA-binding HxlR family transcriptional regulator